MSEPFAILDTDFISKLYLAQNSNRIPFIEKLLKFDYEFCCHVQILIELTRHNESAKNWLENKPDKIKIYSDSDILDMFSSYPLPETVACHYYMNHLKSSCEIYEQSYFKACYGGLINKVNCRDDFLKEIEAGDLQVGAHHNLGEVKNTVLLRALNLCTKKNGYKFCSDDQDTRAHVLAYAAKNNYDLKCISPFSFFFIAKNELRLPKEICDEYFSSWLTHDSNLRISIIEQNGLKRTHPAEEVYSDIWNDSVTCTAEGYIKY